MSERPVTMAEVALIHRSARHLRTMLVIFSPVVLLAGLGLVGMGVATLRERSTRRDVSRDTAARTGRHAARTSSAMFL
jgi:hypothetical protein